MVDYPLSQVNQGSLEKLGALRHLSPVPPALAFRANALADMLRPEPPPAFETFAVFRIRRVFRFGFELGRGIASHGLFQSPSLPAGVNGMDRY